MPSVALACPRCNRTDHVETTFNADWSMYVTTCTGCYDCDCNENGFFPVTEQGVGGTRDASIAEWNDRVEEYEPKAKGAATANA